MGYLRQIFRLRFDPRINGFVDIVAVMELLRVRVSNGSKGGIRSVRGMGCTVYEQIVPSRRL